MPKISIIIPIYNQEKFLRKCLDSIEQQTFRDFEAILVDDGSKDASADICKEYVQRDNRFVYFYKVNGGVSSARQYGHDHVSGEYTIHCDPDDWVEPDWLEALYTEAIRTNADMTICNAYTDTPNASVVNNPLPEDLSIRSVRRAMFHGAVWACWNKLIRTHCYKDNNVRFPVDINYGEDRIYIASVLKHCARIAYIDKPLYHYWNNSSSLSHAMSKKSVEELIRAFEQLYELVDDDQEIRDYLNDESASLILWNAWFCKEFTPTEFKMLSKPYRHHILKSKRMSKMRMLVLLLGSYGPTSLVKKLHSLYLSHK
jgi:glycosyltransferase involved in cell wall biosynthesis